MFLDAFFYLGAWFYTLFAMEVIETPEFNDLDRWENTFGNTVCNIKRNLNAEFY